MGSALAARLPAVNGTGTKEHIQRSLDGINNQYRSRLLHCNANVRACGGRQFQEISQNSQSCSSPSRQNVCAGSRIRGSLQVPSGRWCLNGPIRRAAFGTGISTVERSHSQCQLAWNCNEKDMGGWLVLGLSFILIYICYCTVYEQIESLATSYTP